MNIKKTAIAVLSIVLLFVSGIVPDAFADWYDDISTGTYVEIKGQKFVVDTFCGVDALYNENGSTIYCNELISRFYKEAYGLDVSAGTSGIKMNSEGYKFVPPQTPKPGDVVYVSASMRDGSDHWAIVKYNNGDHLVLFEQNVKNNGKAIIERKLKYPSDSYKLYTPVSTGEKPDPVLKGSSGTSQTTKTTSTTSTTTEPTTVTTTVTTTEKPTTTTTTTATTKPTTTAPTTTRPTTTKPTTTKPVTTTKVTTTLPVTTTTVATTEETSLPLTETTTFAVTFLTVEITENYYSVIQQSTTQVIEENSSESTAKTVIGAVCGLLVMGIAAVVVLIIKKK